MSAQRQRQQPWRSAGRHHCAICNAWMGSDRQSILLHENGRGHREATERAAEARREEKREAERREGSMRDTMGRIEEEARRAMAMDAEAGKLYGGRASVPFLCPPAPPVPAPVPPPPPPPKPKAAGTARPPPGEGGGGGGDGGDRSSWQDRRAKRLRTDDGDAAAADAAPAGSARFGRHRLPPPGEGHYTLEGGGERAGYTWKLAYTGCSWRRRCRSRSGPATGGGCPTGGGRTGRRGSSSGSGAARSCGPPPRRGRPVEVVSSTWG